jgi:hypothetical protein
MDKRTASGRQRSFCRSNELNEADRIGSKRPCPCSHTCSRQYSRDFIIDGFTPVEHKESKGMRRATRAEQLAAQHILCKSILQLIADFGQGPAALLVAITSARNINAGRVLHF